MPVARTVRTLQPAGSSTSCRSGPVPSTTYRERAPRVTAPEPEPFRVDRPFLFYVLDDPTGAILFEGRIVDPR